MKSFNPLTFERTGFGFRCIYWKISNSNRIISLLLLAFYQHLCGCSQDLCLNTMYLRNKDLVEWPLQTYMSGFYKAIGLKDHKAGLRLLACFPPLSTFFLIQAREWHNWKSGSVCFSEEKIILQHFLMAYWGIFFLRQGVPFHIHCIRDSCSQTLKCPRAPSHLPRRAVESRRRVAM